MCAASVSSQCTPSTLPALIQAPLRRWLYRLCQMNSQHLLNLVSHDHLSLLLLLCLSLFLLRYFALSFMLLMPQLRVNWVLLSCDNWLSTACAVRVYHPTFTGHPDWHYMYRLPPNFHHIKDMNVDSRWLRRIVWEFGVLDQVVIMNSTHLTTFKALPWA